MHRKIAVLVSCVFVCVCVGQSRVELARRYPSVSAFEVRPGVVMFASFDKTHRVCEMRIVKDTASDSADNQEFSDEMAEQILSELVPLSTRGRLTSDYFSPDSYVAGGTFLLKQDYRLLSIEKTGVVTEASVNSIRLVKVRWKRPDCGGKT
jgi:hypothetical protein